MKTLLLYNNEAGKGRIAKRIAAIVDIFAARGIAATPKPIVFGQNPFTDDEDVEFKGKNPAPGSIAFVPSVAGLIIASEVIKDLTANLH